MAKKKVQPRKTGSSAAGKSASKSPVKKKPVPKAAAPESRRARLDQKDETGSDFEKLHVAKGQHDHIEFVSISQ